jgi:hypothetical protein
MVFFSRIRHDDIEEISEAEFTRIIIAYADSLRDVHCWVPPQRVVRTFPTYKEQEYFLSMSQRIYLVINSPTSSFLSLWFERVMSFLAIASMGALIASTVPEYMYSPERCPRPACNDDPTFCPGYQICEPVSDEGFVIFEIVCTAIFTVDVIMKIALVGCMPARYYRL